VYTIAFVSVSTMNRDFALGLREAGLLVVFVVPLLLVTYLPMYLTRPSKDFPTPLSVVSDRVERYLRATFPRSTSNSPTPVLYRLTDLATLWVARVLTSAGVKRKFAFGPRPSSDLDALLLESLYLSGRVQDVEAAFREICRGGRTHLRS
jgi:hypothetical protein